MATRIPYLNEFTIDYAVRNASGTLVQPSPIAVTVTDDVTSSSITLAASPTWDATTSTTYLTFAATEIAAARVNRRLTATWSGTACGTSFTDYESLIVVKPNQESWLTTVCEVKELLGVTDATDDDDIGYFIETAQDSLGRIYDLPTVPKQTEARYVNVHDCKYVGLDECNSITSIADESGNAITEYTTVYGKTAAHKLRAVLLDTAYSGQLTITGSWGYDATPADINRALMLTVSTWYKRSKLGDNNDVIGNFNALPREARDIMEARVVASI